MNTKLKLILQQAYIFREGLELGDRHEDLEKSRMGWRRQGEGWMSPGEGVGGVRVIGWRSYGDQLEEPG